MNLGTGEGLVHTASTSFGDAVRESMCVAEVADRMSTVSELETDGCDVGTEYVEATGTGTVNAWQHLMMPWESLCLLGM